MNLFLLRIYLASGMRRKGSLEPILGMSRFLSENIVRSQ